MAITPPARVAFLFAGLLLCCGLLATANGTQPAAAGKAVQAEHGMVVTVSPLATDIGVAILQKGGNAVDAAVAVAFALAVTHPTAGNIGGGGFMVVHNPAMRAGFHRLPGNCARQGDKRHVQEG